MFVDICISFSFTVMAAAEVELISAALKLQNIIKVMAAAEETLTVTNPSFTVKSKR